MSTLERALDDLTRLSASARDFVGQFIYEPFGIESSDAVNAVTLYAGLAILAFASYRLASPAPRPRKNRARSKFDVSRNI